MFRRKKSPKRLYYPTKSRWYTQPRRQTVKRVTRRPMTSNIKNRVSRIFKNTFYYAIAGLFIVFMVLVMIFSSYFSILHIEVLRQDFHIDTAQISNQLNEYIGNNILFFQRRKIVDKIQKNFPEFASVHVKKVLPDTLKIDLKSHPIVANIRAYYVLPEVEPMPDEEADDLIKQALKESFVLDEDESSEKEIEPIEQKCLINEIGQAIFDKEQDLELMTIVLTGLSQPIEDRQVIVPEEKMNYILDSIKYFSNLFKMEIVGVEYLPIAREVHLKTDAGFVIWITVEKDFKEQIDKLSTIYEAAELNKEELAYIDLRVKEKVIYCPLRSNCNPPK
ncbi:FtsQ-type POTRA domain-containing protein [Candidatus Peregrinibacteria bacterium]|nr:FtsQ-type POTRA domain-containing protein [Candidatus Peregrinibacteria bacterium]